MGWVVAAAAVWLVLAVLGALLIGRGIRIADEKAAGSAAARPTGAPNFVVDVHAEPITTGGAADPPSPRPTTSRPPAAAPSARPTVPRARRRLVPGSSRGANRTPSSRDAGAA
jgi:hypothetical protein